MRNIYITVGVLFVLSIILFVSAFIYLDKEKHKTYDYIVNLDNHDIGLIKIEKFVTEDKLIYKSTSSIPFYPIMEDSKTRMTLDRKYNLESYSLEKSGNRASEGIYLENKEGVITFLSTFQSEFAYLNNIPLREGTFVFAGDSPVTYFPLIENYDFRKGRSQGFKAISNFSIFLPPMKKIVTFTSIRDEYLKIDSKKIKAECILIKIKNYPQIKIWVSKFDRHLLALEMPSKGLKITRTFSLVTIEAKKYALSSTEYSAKDLSFINNNIKLTGTITVPNKEGKHPAVLLIWGAGPHDRHYMGLFTSITDYLSKNGFCVFSFDKRGIGASEGDFLSTTDTDEIEDLTVALECLAKQKEVDPNKVAVFGHSKGAFYAAELTKKKDIAKTVILAAPITSFWFNPDKKDEDLKTMASKLKWSDDYLKLVVRSRVETTDKVKRAKGNRVSILGKRCFVKRIKEELGESPLSSIKALKIPVLILQGKEDEEVPVESASIVDQALEESGNVTRTVTYFGYLGHFFGKNVNDGVYKIHYDVDEDVLKTLKSWLDKNLAETEALVSEDKKQPAENLGQK